MRAARGAKWITLFRYESRKLRVIHEPLRNYEIHNLLSQGWEEVKNASYQKVKRRNSKK